VRVGAVVACATLLVGCASVGGSQRGDDGERSFAPDRAEVALALLRYDAATDDSDRSSALAAAWRHRGALVDDTLLRQLVRQAPAVPAELRADQLVEQAGSLASSPDATRQVLAQLQNFDDPGGDATRWTAARRLLLLASILPSAAEQQALAALNQVHRLAPQGGIGAAQRAQAWLMEGSLQHQSGRYKEAIAAYLKVEASSGLWREGRLGMAWCQLRIAQPDRAIAVLALLPGGLTGDPERALVAAMAAGALNKLEGARAIIEEARARSGAWLDGEVDPAALLETAMPVGASLRLREEDEGLAARLRAHPTVRLFAAELRAARALSGRPEFAAHVARLEAAWPGLVAPLVTAQRDRVRRALEALDALEPQLK